MAGPLPRDLDALLDAVASDAPAPGGGSVSSLAGAAGAALGEMVLRLTQSKGSGGYEPDDLASEIGELEGLRSSLLEAVDDDAASYDGVVAAYRLPKGSEGEQMQRRLAIQHALEHATRVPLETARASLRVLELLSQAAERGHAQAVTDAGVGSVMAHAAVTGALYNVSINAIDLADQEFVSQVLAEAARLEERAGLLREAANQAVRRRLHE